MVTALSYAWGKDETDSRVEAAPTGVDELLATLSVRRNLESALRHLRQPNASRVLWIDAICIDQTNLAERNHEVNRMGKIYTLARRVVVWLGPAATSSTRAMNIFASIGQTLVITDRYLFNRPFADELYDSKAYLDVDVPDLWEGHKLSIKALCTQQVPLDNEDYHGLRNVLERAWWSRLWYVETKCYALVGAETKSY